MSPRFNPIPPGMPLDRAADLMVRRGECANFYLARARVARSRRRDHGRTEITPTDREAFSHVEQPQHRQVRLPYKDE